MCGRYVSVTSVSAIEKRFNAQPSTAFVQCPPAPNTNISHGEQAAVIIGPAAREMSVMSDLSKMSLTLDTMQFGFTPTWAKKQFYMVNARSEGDHNKANDPRYTGAMGILQKPMFRQSIRNRRCLVVADAFIEGPQHEKLSKPYVVYARGGAGARPFGLAGIWDAWTDLRTGELIRSFAVITTTACDVLQDIGHHRSPVMITADDERRWLDPSTSLQDVTGMLHPIADGVLNAYPIDPQIKNPRANGTALLQPVGQHVFPEVELKLNQSLEMFGMGENRRNSR